ncbi:MAG: type III-A CRISPR-associated RAMP protein Csm5 [Bacteroidales bacterium]
MNSKFSSTILRFKVDTLTPVHTGSGRVLQNGIDYLVREGKVWYPDLKKLFEFVGEAGLQQWATDILEEKNFLEEIVEKRHKKVSEFSKQSLPYEAGVERQVNQLREQFRNTYTGNPVLPGSSIKGALRTALITQKLIFSFRGNTDRIGLDKLNNNNHHNKLMAEAISINRRENAGPQNDIFRFLAVPDAELRPEDLKVYRFRTLNYKSYSNYETWMIDRKLDILGEAIEGSFEMEMRISSRFFDSNRLGIKRPGDIIETINKHTMSILEPEIESFQDDLDNDFFEDSKFGEDFIDQMLKLKKAGESKGSALMRLGFGSGWDYMTGSWLKEINNVDEDEEDKFWNEVKKRLRRRGYEDFFFPKTRKVLSDGRLPGFVLLKLIDTNE